MVDIGKSITLTVTSLISMFILATQIAEARPISTCDLEIFVDSGFSGASSRIGPRRSISISNVSRQIDPKFHDQISSMKIRAGIWEFYLSEDFSPTDQGVWKKVGPGAYSTVPTNDQYDSFRCITSTRPISLP